MSSQNLVAATWRPCASHWKTAITISRASGTLTFPANFILVAALNPCPCGYFGDDRHECTCSMSMVQRYQKRISGSLLDRMDSI